MRYENKRAKQPLALEACLSDCIASYLYQSIRGKYAMLDPSIQSSDLQVEVEEHAEGHAEGQTEQTEAQIERPVQDQTVNDLHPIELTAHALLNGPLENLHENFELLTQSQYILLTRLKLIENRLTSFEKAFCEEGLFVNDRDVQNSFSRIKELRKLLLKSLKTLSKISDRVNDMSTKLELDEDLV